MENTVYVEIWGGWPYVVENFDSREEVEAFVNEHNGQYEVNGQMLPLKIV